VTGNRQGGFQTGLECTVHRPHHVENAPTSSRLLASASQKALLEGHTAHITAVDDTSSIIQVWNVEPGEPGPLLSGHAPNTLVS